jgi:hypothetical protein
MNCQGNVNSTLPTQLPHKFSYIVAILGHNHFESTNICENVFLCAFDMLLCLFKTSKRILQYRGQTITINISLAKLFSFWYVLLSFSRYFNYFEQTECV